MNNPFRAIFTGQTLSETLLSASRADQQQMETYGQNLTDAEVTKLGNWLFQKLSIAHVQSVVWIGGMLYLYQIATKPENRRELFERVIGDFGISETKAYDAISIFRCWGQVLLEKPQLMNHFPVESLKLLSAKHVPVETRRKAIEFAQSGRRVSIKQAQSLLCGLPKAKNNELPQLKRSTQIWSFTGEVIQLVLKTDQPKKASKLKIFDDLKAALQAYHQAWNQTDTQQLTITHHSQGAK